MLEPSTKRQQANLGGFDENGFILARNVLPEADIRRLEAAIDLIRRDSASLSAPGVRGLLKICPAVRAFAIELPLFDLITAVLGSGARPVRAILFDKSLAANWYVTWHQDLSIPVTHKMDLPGFGSWSLKDGTTHVQPPAAILERMVSARIHLDACNLGNGEIKFIPGSHKCGFLDPDAIAWWRNQREAVSCPAKRGDIILMRPLILHSSSKSEQLKARRVLHIEYENATLPSGLEWAEA